MRKAVKYAQYAQIKTAGSRTPAVGREKSAGRFPASTSHFDNFLLVAFRPVHKMALCLLQAGAINERHRTS
jgi:hypothetical protein